MDSCAAAVLPGRDYPMSTGEKRNDLYVVRSPSDIDGRSPLKQQLEPNLKNQRGPDKTQDFSRNCACSASNIPKIE